jgi:hypothetical protein
MSVYENGHGVEAAGLDDGVLETAIEEPGDLEAGPPKVFAPPHLDGRHVSLRSITPNDYAWLQRAELSSELSVRWRFRGGTPSPENWAQSIWAGALAQFIVVERRNESPAGLVSVYKANFQHGHAALAAARFNSGASPVMIFGIAMFLRYVFTCWNFRKLYMELPEYNYPQLASGLGRLFEIEGRLKDHNYYAGQFWDEVILAIYRERWLERGRWLMSVA